MERSITGFHRDDLHDWVAELDCYHGQHVRHKPPFFNRPWTETEVGRQSMLGTMLDCVRCDHLEFPAGLTEYKRTPVFTETTVAAGLLHEHSTKAGVWGMILVEEGMLEYTVHYPEDRIQQLHGGDTAVVVPQMKHRVRPLDVVRFCVAFYRRES